MIRNSNSRSNSNLLLIFIIQLILNIIKGEDLIVVEYYESVNGQSCPASLIDDCQGPTCSQAPDSTEFYIVGQCYETTYGSSKYRYESNDNTVYEDKYSDSNCQVNTNNPDYATQGFCSFLFIKFVYWHIPNHCSTVQNNEYKHQFINMQRYSSNTCGGNINKNMNKIDSYCSQPDGVNEVYQYKVNANNLTRYKFIGDCTSTATATSDYPMDTSCVTKDSQNAKIYANSGFYCKSVPANVAALVRGSSKSDDVGMILGLVFGVGGALTLLIVGLYYHQKSQKSKQQLHKLQDLQTTGSNDAIGSTVQLNTPPA